MTDAGLRWPRALRVVVKEPWEEDKEGPVSGVEVVMLAAEVDAMMGDASDHARGQVAIEEADAILPLTTPRIVTTPSRTQLESVRTEHWDEHSATEVGPILKELVVRWVAEREDVDAAAMTVILTTPRLGVRISVAKFGFGGRHLMGPGILGFLVSCCTSCSQSNQQAIACRSDQVN